jgi:hypothetical protein
MAREQVPAASKGPWPRLRCPRGLQISRAGRSSTRGHRPPTTSLSGTPPPGRAPASCPDPSRRPARLAPRRRGVAKPSRWPRPHSLAPPHRGVRLARRPRQDQTLPSPGTSRPGPAQHLRGVQGTRLPRRERPRRLGPRLPGARPAQADPAARQPGPSSPRPDRQARPVLLAPLRRGASLIRQALAPSRGPMAGRCRPLRILLAPLRRGASLMWRVLAPSRELVAGGCRLLRGPRLAGVWCPRPAHSQTRLRRGAVLHRPATGTSRMRRTSLDRVLSRRQWPHRMGAARARHRPGRSRLVRIR